MIRPLADVQMPGAGQAARTEARAKARETTMDKHRRIAAALEKFGPLTRTEIAAATGLKINSTNGRVAELRALPHDHPWRCVTFGRRGSESIVHLARNFTGSEK